LCPNATPKRSWSCSWKNAADMSDTSLEVTFTLCPNTKPANYTCSWYGN
jgi:hypothetical protein